MRIDTLPIHLIDPEALIRDRSVENPAALDDLIRSITEIGLRQPIEVFGLAPREHSKAEYGLISGHRRLKAFVAMGRTEIPALLCNPEGIPAAMAAMVTENEVRAQITPWEKGRLIGNLLDDGAFKEPDEAIAALYPTATRQQRARIRNAHLVYEAFHHHIQTPERLTHTQIDRLATCLRVGGEEVLLLTLRNDGHHGTTLETQWAAMRPVMNAMLSEEPDYGPAEEPQRRESRHSMTTHGGDFRLTREKTRTGWIIRFSGPMAKSPGLVDNVFELVERWLGPIK
jgi:ParB family transcriptional regulator, chromosome partitioning protein